MSTHLLNRRQFSARCAAVGLAFPASALIASQAHGQTPDAGPRTVTFPNGTIVPAVGQGSWHLGQGRRRASIEEEAMRTGIALGMTVIDTSRNYGENGESEKFVGRVIKGQRDKIFLISKVQADEIELNRMEQAINGSLMRLGTDYLDLYLLHSPLPSRYVAGTVAKFEELRAAGRIRAWGVSNFSVEQMEELWAVPDGNKCATNQVRYSINNRFAERDVLPWCVQHKIPMMAASPLGGLGDARIVLAERTLVQLGQQHGVSAAAVALGFVTRSGNVIAIPESGNPAHVKENAAALTIRWIPADA